MALKAGSLNDTSFEYAGSMARAMEIAFLEEWPKVMGDSDIPKMNKQMSLMFVAIAKGVINHLNANPGAFISSHPSVSPPVTLNRIEKDL